MPAMSPTMTEGNIASWKLKEGDKFFTGDVLLEIETDKAQMEVEAQDDGVIAKITQGDGTKSVKVGTRIAVLAEQSDDLESLEMPAEDSPSNASPQKSTTPSNDPSKSFTSQADSPTSGVAGTPQVKPRSSKADSKSQSTIADKTSKQTYPLYPSVSQLLREHNVPVSEAARIPASGPKGRLLKGDVLAYLGTIDISYSSDQSSRISKLGHLDLSNVYAAPRRELSPDPSPHMAVPLAPTPEPDVKMTVTVSLKAVFDVQKRVQDTLGITIPLSTFLSRAADIANDNLPCVPSSQPSTDELFNQVLGLNNVGLKTSRGSFTPQITALPSLSLSSKIFGPRKQLDIIDTLSGKRFHNTSNFSRSRPPSILAESSSTLPSKNVFSINAKRDDEKRARVFLERVKTMLQVEPGSLVL